MKTKLITVSVMILVLSALLCSCGFISSILPGGDNGDNGGNTTNNSNELYFVFHDVPNSFNATANDFYNSKTGLLRIPASEPVKDGYEFVDWYSDELYAIPFPVGTKPTTKEVHIYAKWAVAKYDITVYDKLNPTEKYEIEYKKIPELVEPEEEGYIFDGWYIDEDYTVEYVADKVTSDLELYVKWDYCKYEIEYVTNGGTTGSDAVVEFTVNDTVVLPTPEKTGYTFIGWYDNADLIGNTITEFNGEIGDKKFYAKYLCNLTTMEAKSGLSAMNGKNCEFYSDSTAKSIDLEDYFTFVQGCTYLVYLNEEKTQLSKGNTVNLENNETETGILREYNFIIMIISESGTTSSDYYLTVYQYDRNVITISYYVDDEKVDEINVNKGHASENYYWGGEKVGYEFVCWMNGSEEYVFGTTVTEDLRLDAKFSPIIFNIEYKTGAGTNSILNKTEYTIEDSFVLSDAVCPVGYGYTFEGWYQKADYAEDSKITAVDSMIGDLKLYAKYAKDSILDFEADEEGKYEIDKTQYEEFINFAVYNRLESVDVTVNGIESQDEFAEVNQIEIYVPFADYSQSLTYSLRESENCVIAKITYTYSQAEEPSKKSNTGTYTQNNFEKWEIGIGREGFVDFAINYVETTLKVKTGDQLYFALENGYRPLCVEGSTAEQVYEEAKEILNSILDLNMIEKEKAMAIAEYLVESVAYDNYVLDLFNSVYEPGISNEERELRNAAIKEYRSFSPEAAIIDKVAVCDGISKAYVILCAIEGIRAVQVDGKNKSTNHAWNKVYVDIDGNGTKEWSVVDCTSANMLINSGIELMDHAFIFASDDMILSNDVGYEYNEKWQDGLLFKYPTTETINVYDTYEVTFEGTKISLYAETKDELTVIFKYIKQIYDELESGTKMCFDFSVSSTLHNLDWSHDVWIVDTMQTVFNMGVSHCKCEGQTDEDGVIILILEK